MKSCYIVRIKVPRERKWRDWCVRLTEKAAKDEAHRQRARGFEAQVQTAIDDPELLRRKNRRAIDAAQGRLPGLSS